MSSTQAENYVRYARAHCFEAAVVEGNVLIFVPVAKRINDVAPFQYETSQEVHTCTSFQEVRNALGY